MRYFITGATGILGQYLIKTLIEEGKQVIALKRKNSHITKALKDLPSEQLKWVEGDILDTFSYSDYLTSETTVIHTAATVSFQPSEEPVMFKVNIEGTKNLIDTALEKRIHKFIHISSIASIGRIKGLTLLDENTKWQDGPDHSSYAESKYYAELEVWRGYEEGLKGFILNPSVILAQSDWTKSSSVIFKKTSSGSLFHPPGSINTVDVRDVVESLLLLDKKEVNHQRYICNGSFDTYKNFISLIAEEFNKKKPQFSVNHFLLKSLVVISSLLRLIGKKPVFTSESIKSMESINEFDSSKILKEINFNFRSSKETASWAVPYYVKKYNL